MDETQRLRIALERIANADDHVPAADLRTIARHHLERATPPPAPDVRGALRELEIEASSFLAAQGLPPDEAAEYATADTLRETAAKARAVLGEE